ncbi:transposase [Rhizorhapis suberifaciens]|uniref:Transposase n=1 Tax=Rhizorhapis suberifaciens TaxID=13656 RepID=A0A840HSL6_9SPHN|nr:transposase [Rhizorhapis suberifaciens]
MSKPQLAPTLQPGDMVILDNLSSHKSEKAAASLKECPDLNPLEMAFAKLKAHSRKAKVRTVDALWQAVGSICELYSPDQCWNYLKDAGYVAH